MFRLVVKVIDTLLLREGEEGEELFRDVELLQEGKGGGRGGLTSYMALS